MYEKSKRAAWAEISKENLVFNINSIKNKVGSSVEICGIIKADGYGHGSVFMAKTLEEEGVKSFGVATLDEAITLRKAGIEGRIVLLGITPSMYANTLVENDFTAVVCSLENAKAISEEAGKASKIVDIYIAIDTGMGRIGYPAEDFEVLSELKEISKLENLNILGLFSHFATADAVDKTYARKQEAAFNKFYDVMAEGGVVFPIKTLANSAGVMELTSAHFDMVRPGIVLYGLYPSEEVDKRNLAIKPVMTVKANIVHLKTVPAGTTVSYGQSFLAKRDSVIGTLSLGYADGYPRPFSKDAKVIVNGRFAPIAGNICMDQCMVDLTEVHGVEVGDEVIIMGTDGKLSVLADDIARATGTINYEIACAFGQRLPKVYV